MANGSSVSIEKGERRMENCGAKVLHSPFSILLSPFSILFFGKGMEPACLRVDAVFHN
jgi:hypothetical protein